MSAADGREASQGRERGLLALLGRLPRGTVLALCLVILVAAATTVRLPVLVERPGDPVPTSGALTVDGRPGDALDGEFAISTVRRGEATPWTALLGAVDPGRTLRPTGEIVPPDEDFEGYRERQRLVFEGSVRTAAAVALAEAGLAVEQHLEVVQVLEGAPAEAHLEPQDRLLAVDGQALETQAELSQRLEAGEPTTLTIERDGEQREVRLTPARFSHAGEEHEGLGVLLQQQPDLPVPVDADLDRISGPSAGLLLALTVYDVIDEDVDLARGRLVAGSGTLNLEGQVGPVGSIEAKVAGAIAADVDVFLVPEVNADAAREAADGALDVVGVATFGESVEALTEPDGDEVAGPWCPRGRGGC